MPRCWRSRLPPQAEVDVRVERHDGNAEIAVARESVKLAFIEKCMTLISA